MYKRQQIKCLTFVSWNNQKITTINMFSFISSWLGYICNITGFTLSGNSSYAHDHDNKQTINTSMCTETYLLYSDIKWLPLTFI